MVASYAQLLARRYRGKLDHDADEFIEFIVDGAARMQDLINDLLAYSRVGTQGRPLQRTDADAVVQRVVRNLGVAIEDAQAEVQWQDLPEVSADERQLAQLFQNLIANAVKFRGEAAPVVQIEAAAEEAMVRFSVRDNGIGMDPEYLQRIFLLFQRLHSKREYPGTGIGLAICKKIVERHGGRIWVESAPGGGSTFYFTLPTVQHEE